MRSHAFALILLMSVALSASAQSKDTTSVDTTDSSWKFRRVDLTRVDTSALPTPIKQVLKTSTYSDYTVTRAESNPHRTRFKITMEKGSVVKNFWFDGKGVPVNRKKP